MTDLNLEPRKRFDLFYNPDLNVAKSNVALYFESLHLQEMDLGQKVLALCQEYNLVTHDVDGFIRKDYLNVADNESRLYNIFFGHLLIDHCDEEPQILEGLILHEKHHCIGNLLKNLKFELPVFTYSDFLKGAMDVMFYELGQKPTHTSNEEYFKMRLWQIQKKVECVNLEFGKLRQRFIEKFGNSPALTDYLWSEKHRLDGIFRDARQWITHQFFTKLSMVEALLPHSLPENMKEFHELFCSFFLGKSFPHALSPPMLHQAHQDIEAGKISAVPMCCWSLIKFQGWLTDVLEEKIGLMDPPDPDYELLFEQTFERGIARSKMLIWDFMEKYPTGKVSEEKYKSILLSELSKLREKFNKLEFPEYYQLLLNKENVKINFINHCFLNIGIDNQICGLSKAIVLNEMIKFYKSELFKIDESLIKPSLDIAILKNQFADIISAMVPNPDISDQLWRAFARTSLAVTGRKPILFIVEDLKDSMRLIFKQAIIDLKQLLDTQPENVIAAYAAYQLRELELLALISPKFGQDLNEYFEDLKKLFEIELKYPPCLQSTKLANIGILSHGTQKREIEKLSFGYKKSPGFLTPFIQALNDKIDFLDYRTTIDDFVRMVTSENLHSIHDKIYLGCKTNEFRYLANYFKPFFKSFNPATIGKSGIFISNTGTPITATNLNSAMIESMKTRYAIDNIFNKKH